MKLGVIARGEDRGLGNQTYEVCKALRPAQVLLVDMGDLSGGFPLRAQRFLDLGLRVTIVPHDQMADRAVLGPWLKHVDVVYSAETFYAPEFPAIARSLGVATVCHMNPEFYKHWNEPSWPTPTAWWVPSPWLLDDPRLPAPRFVPQPSPWGDVPVNDARRPGGPLRVLHVAGKPAAGDRNGSRVLLRALRHVTAPMEVTVRAQASSFPHPPRLSRAVSYRPRLGNVADYRAMYADHDVLVMPRRYGGLCLPVQEAAAAGLAVVMTDCPPNSYYPAMLVRSTFEERFPVPLGEITAYDADPRMLADVLDALATIGPLLEGHRRRALDWAREHSWEALADTWTAALTDAVEAEASRK